MPDLNKVIKALDWCTATVKDCDPCPTECPYYGKCMGNNGLFFDLMKDALALLKAQAWHILTEDDDGIIHGLPGDDGQYFMTDGKDIWIDDYVDGVSDGIFLDSGRDIREVTAWMYMPELPKQDRR